LTDRSQTLEALKRQGRGCCIVRVRAAGPRPRRTRQGEATTARARRAKLPIPLLGPRAVLLLSALGFLLSATITLRAALAPSLPVARDDAPLDAPQPEPVEGEVASLGPTNGIPLEWLQFYDVQSTDMQEEGGDESREVDLSKYRKSEQQAETEVELSEDTRPSSSGGAGRTDPFSAAAGGSGRPGTAGSIRATPSASNLGSAATADFNVPGGPVIGGSAAAAVAETEPVVPTPTPAEPHDLAVTQIRALSRIVLRKSYPVRTGSVRVEIQNRSPTPETIEDSAMLEKLVTLTAGSLGSCPNAPTVLHDGPPQEPLPRTLAPKEKLTVVFDVTFDCANDPLRTTAADPGHDDYSYTATVSHAAIDGEPDTHPVDDVCPRSVTPPFVVDPNPDGTIQDRGCGKLKPDRTFGAPVTTDVIVK